MFIVRKTPTMLKIPAGDVELSDKTDLYPQELSCVSFPFVCNCKYFKELVSQRHH